MLYGNFSNLFWKFEGKKSLFFGGCREDYFKRKVWKVYFLGKFRLERVKDGKRDYWVEGVWR